MSGRRVSARGRITYFDKTDPHALYRVFDRFNRVIYIGSSHDPDGRMTTHRSEQKWRGEIVRWVPEWHQDWFTANRVEHDAIWREDPDHNFVGTTLSAIISRVRSGPIVSDARQRRIARIEAEKRGDIEAARVAHEAFLTIAADVGIPASKVRLIAGRRELLQRTGW